LADAILRFHFEHERSPRRVTICKETTTRLQEISARWTTRDVGLWFPNNQRAFCAGLSPALMLDDSPPQFDGRVRLSDVGELEISLAQALA
jgi:hypothetical protein